MGGFTIAYHRRQTNFTLRFFIREWRNGGGGGSKHWNWSSAVLAVYIQWEHAHPVDITSGMQDTGGEPEKDMQS